MKSTKERYINHYINHQILDDWKNDLALMGEDYVPIMQAVKWSEENGLFIEEDVLAYRLGYISYKKLEKLMN